MDLARGRSPGAQDLVWRMAPGEDREFFDLVFNAAQAAGGLRVHPYLGEDLPIEALPHGEGDWSTSFPILRLSQFPAGSAKFAGRRRSDRQADSAPGQTEGPESILVYFNPAGLPLPAAEAEARAVLEMLQGLPVRFIARVLTAGEWEREFDGARVIVYFGHGKNISGLPAIPGSGDDWLPFLPEAQAGGRTLFFNACLDGGAGGLRTPGNFCVYPVCRIADRPAPFFADLVRNCLAGQDPGQAFVAAARADSAAGDIRRLVFRMQGSREGFH